MKLTFFAQRPTGDVVVTMPGADTPAFRILVPECIDASNLDIPKRAQSILPWPGPYFHCAPQTWTTNPLRGELTFPNFLQAITVIESRGECVAITWELRNLSSEPWEKPRADFCFGVASGEGRWSNKEFLPETKLNRGEDGEYWHDRVASRGAYVHSGGQWVKFVDVKDKPLDASIIAVGNEKDEAFAFMMWDAPAPTPSIASKNACMHLRPQLGSTLAPGKMATIRGRAGITHKGLAEIWRLYQELLNDTQ
jgi:hypothetical protein